jgi:hypothetical protein
MPSEQELLDRIRHLEEQNNELQDKLDAIYSILAPDYETPDFESEELELEDARHLEDAQAGGGFVQIDGIKPA